MLYRYATSGARLLGTTSLRFALHGWQRMRKTFATRLLSRGAAITDVQHLLGHASVKTTERAYAAFVKNERFKQTIDLLDKPTQPRLKIVK
jgi:integrase